MKAKSSAREDNVSSKIIKHYKDEIRPSLKDLMNKSLNNGVFPNGLKIGS